MSGQRETCVDGVLLESFEQLPYPDVNCRKPTKQLQFVAEG